MIENASGKRKLVWLDLPPYRYSRVQNLYTELIYTMVKKFGVSNILFLRKVMLLFSTDALNWSKITAKTFITLQKCFYSSKNPEKNIY